MPKARSKTKRKIKSGSSALDDVILLIPGYDPVATARDCVFDEQSARNAIEFFPGILKHIEGERARQPFELGLWQQAIVANLFGWKRPDGSRRYREAFIYIPRKNGKTPLAAGIANYVLFNDHELGGQNFCAAADTDQATLLFRHAKGMVEFEPALQRRARVYAGLGHRSIVYEAENSFLKVLSADASTKHGGNAHLIIIDELHAQPNRDLVDVLQTSLASANRRQPLLLFITTADFERDSICNEKHDYACKVRDGIIDDFAFLPVVYEASQDDDWTSEKTWEKANPNIDVSVSRDYLRRECQKAQEQASYENTFKRLHLNIKTQQDVRWIRLEDWDQCGGQLPQLEKRECFAGLDLASTTDICALSLVFPASGGNYDIRCLFWVPAENAEQRERRDRVPYISWSKQGYIKLTGGNVADYDVIRRDINDLSKEFNIRQIAIDRWNATQLMTQLDGDGFDVVPFGQGYASMSAPSKEFEKLVVGGHLRHGNNPVLRWMASNVAAEMDAAGNIKPSKKKSTERIDGIVATVMALGLATAAPLTKPSVYKTRGLVAI